MKHLIITFLSIMTIGATLAQDEKSEIALLHTPSGIILELKKEVRIPAGRNSVNLYFIDETICVAELMLKENAQEEVVIPEGHKLRVYRTEAVRLKDYFGYTTGAYLFFKDHQVDNIMFACPDMLMKLKDLDESTQSDNYFKIDYSRAEDTLVKPKKRRQALRA